MSPGAATVEQGRNLSWYLPRDRTASLLLRADGGPDDPRGIRRQATGRGVRVCVVDSGVEGDHPLVGRVDGAWEVRDSPDGHVVEPCAATDRCGHGTAAAGIVRRVAPDCELHSLRVLGANARGTGELLLAGLRWAVRQRFDVVNLSLSTASPRHAPDLHRIADDAYFAGTVIVASAHNSRVESFPWRFASVISVGSHLLDDPDLVLYNPHPPVEFFAAGENVPVAWPGGGRAHVTGNSFATPYVAGLCALFRSRYPRLTPFQVKTLLYLSAANVNVSPGGVPCQL